jgi:hypothetical protein
MLKNQLVRVVGPFGRGHHAPRRGATTSGRVAGALSCALASSGRLPPESVGLGLARLAGCVSLSLLRPALWRISGLALSSCWPSLAETP